METKVGSFENTKNSTYICNKLIRHDNNILTVLLLLETSKKALAKNVFIVSVVITT